MFRDNRSAYYLAIESTTDIGLLLTILPSNIVGYVLKQNPARLYPVGMLFLIFAEIGPAGIVIFIAVLGIPFVVFSQIQLNISYNNNNLIKKKPFSI
jgi:hypothetical protein